MKKQKEQINNVLLEAIALRKAIESFLDTPATIESYLELTKPLMSSVEKFIELVMEDQVAKLLGSKKDGNNE